MTNSIILIIGVVVLIGGIAQTMFSGITAYVISKYDTVPTQSKSPLAQSVNLAYLYYGTLIGGVAIMLTGIALIMLGSGSFPVIGGRR